MDYIAVANRWKNMVLNAEADHEPNIDTDHNPVIATMRLKLKGISKQEKHWANTKFTTTNKNKIDKQGDETQNNKGRHLSCLSSAQVPPLSGSTNKQNCSQGSFHHSHHHIWATD